MKILVDTNKTQIKMRVVALTIRNENIKSFHYGILNSVLITSCDIENL